MTVLLKEISKDFDLTQTELINLSLRTYFEKKLDIIEAELYILSKKYGVKNVFEFDKAIKNGKFHEEDSFEDFYKFDNLSAQRKKILSYLEKV